jgi:2-keto-3-deoxy-L-rhamnonate aldolase RhmA
MKINIAKSLGYALLAALTVSLAANAQGQAMPQPKLYNNAKQKLLEGKVLSSYTVGKADPALYCEVAKHYDFIWFEMQHSTLTWADIEKMIAACPHSVATPMVRIADELESSIQHATDIGLLGIIMPTVDTVEKAQAAVRYAKYPPEGRRSMGAGQAAKIWIGDSADDRMKYRTTVNDNMLVIAMIETPIGVANAYDIASVPGIDGILIANTDLANFSGWFDRESGPYQGMLRRIHEATKRAGKYLGATGPVPPTPFPRSEFSFYQGGPSIDGWTPPRAAPVAAPAKK